MIRNNSIIKENIRRHINFSASVAVIGRGDRLYKSGAVHFYDYIEETDTWKFFVKGSRMYQVNVRGVDSSNIETSCTCPFDWGETCKHTIAALLFISDEIDNRGEIVTQKTKAKHLPVKEKNLPKRTGPDSGFELTTYKTITKDFILQNASERVLTKLLYLYPSDSDSTIKIEDNKIIFKSQTEDENGTVKIFKENGKVYISSSEKDKPNSLTLAEIICLKNIAESPTPDLLDQVFSGKLKERENAILNSYGLNKTEKFSDYFYYLFDSGDGLGIYHKKNSIGLLPVTNVQHPVLQFIDKSNSNEQVFDKLIRVKEKREIGFVLRIPDNRYDSYYDNEPLLYKIVPIIAKTNKTGTALTSHFQELVEADKNNYEIKSSENAKDLLTLIDEIEEEEDAEARFQLQKKAFYLLLNEKFVFGMKDDSIKIRKNNLEPITLSPTPFEVIFEISKQKKFIRSELKIKINEVIYKTNKIDKDRSDFQICVVNGIYYMAKNYKAGDYLTNFDKTFKMVYQYKDEFFKKVIQPLSTNFEIVFKRGTFNVETVELDFNKKQVFLSEQDEYIIISPQVVYHSGVSVLLNSTGNVIVREDEKVTEYKRNFELEDEFVDLISELHPDFENQKAKKVFYLHHTEFVENMWFYKFFDELQANDVEVFGLKELKNFKYSPFKGKINTSVSSGQDWFEVDVNVSFGDNTVSLNDIKKAVINKQKFIQLKDGSVGILPSEWLHKLEKYFRNGEIRKDKLEISKLRYSIVDELFDSIDDAEIIEEITEKRQRLSGIKEITKTVVPKQVKAELRPYQKEGLNWLNFLDEMQWGGILADDMGLGKTLQVLAFIQHKNKGRNKKSTSLVVVPTTLLFNWENEIKKFTPSLKAFFYYGPDREKSTEAFANYEIVFTTYGILLRDIELLRGFAFDYAILDESQAIKNPASRRFKAAVLINAKNRFALTGTPIENSTFDLFAQMSFVNRGFLGSVKSFKENYSTPIDKNGDELIASELQRLVNPFILRRTKETVATELPAKTENIIYCEMENEQRRVYDAYRNEYKNRLLNKIENEGIGKSKMMVLEALTRLRQICDSPSLLNANDINVTQSVKIKEIVRHITNKTGNHKILIFSQFVKMLSLVKDELSKRNIDFEYLDGKSSSKQREQSVNNFQENEDLRVFLISLKAGGTGLNLTAADYVYIVDPWWNPAVENQAIDRCHRIGQDKKVFAYRMICKNTVEEKILNLQNKKKKIAGDIIQTDESILKKLNTNDIKELFSDRT